MLTLPALLMGCGATGPLGERLLKARLLSEEKKGVLVVCFKANAILYGDGITAVVKTTAKFKGKVEVKAGCEIEVNTEGEDEESNQ